MANHRRMRWGVLLLLTAGLAGCGRNDVQVYRIAKEEPQGPETQQNAGMMMPPGHPDTSGGGPSLQWKLPPGWEEAPAGQMRLASFRVKGKDDKVADVGVFPLGGMAGTELDNVNRWRGLVNLQPISEAELPKLAEPVQIAGEQAKIFDLSGETPASGEKTRILVAMMRRNGTSWFFKMTGDDALVAEEKPAFMDFLKSLSFSTATQPALPPSHPPIDSAAMTLPGVSSASSEAKPKWQVPVEWHEIPSGPFLVAKFQVPGSQAQETDVNVSMSAGDGGGLVPNVNRWRRQLGLEGLAGSEVNKLVSNLDVDGGKAMQVEMTGTNAKTGQKARLVAVIVPKSGQTWFYKLMGNEQTVEREKPAFTKFVQTAKYSNAL